MDLSTKPAVNHSPPEGNKEERILLEPYQYISQIPGKQVRTKLATAFNYWLKVPDDILYKIGEITQMLHNASLLIDDIEDNSILRRGIPVAHKIYGIAHTINSANYIYFKGLEKALELGNPQVTAVFTEQLLELHRGQGMDIYWRDSFTCPTEEEYKQMVIRKTGGLFGLAVRLMQIFSNNKRSEDGDSAAGIKTHTGDLKPLCGTLGLYFQIRDDYANLNSKEYEANKSFGEDLTEGKFSFPIIHGIRSQPDQQIMSILRQRTSDLEVKKYCVEYLHKIGSLDYTRKVLIELEEQLQTEIRALGGNPHLISLIEDLSKVYKEGS